MSQSTEIVDILIIGGGPSGMFAAFYGGMRQCSVKIIESMPQLGGQLAALYPEKYIYDIAGFPKITAQELINNLSDQMSLFKETTQVCLNEKVIQVTKKEECLFEIYTDQGVHLAKSIIITAGVGAFEPRRLGHVLAPTFEGTYLHYFVDNLQKFKDQRVLISGGGDSAVDWALMLEKIASKVILVHRRDQFRAHEHSVEKLFSSTVEIITPAEIGEIYGTEKIDKIDLVHPKTKEVTPVEVDHVIVNFGFVSSLGPITEWGLDIEKNVILVHTTMQTNIPGIFAAGDITHYPGKVKLIACGFGEAPIAVNNAKVYIDPHAKLSPGHSSNMKL